jgi:hypothetical protein
MTIGFSLSLSVGLLLGSGELDASVFFAAVEHPETRTAPSKNNVPIFVSFPKIILKPLFEINNKG